MSPAFACGGAPVAKSHRSQEYAGERTYRRQASGKAAIASPSRGRREARCRAERTEQQAEKAPAKVELPEPRVRLGQAEAKPQRGSAEPPKDKSVAERKVETEKAYRTTSSPVGHGLLLRL